MRIFRATNTAVIKYIEPKIRPADGVSKEQYLVNLAAWLQTAPDTLYLQVAFNDENLLIGLMVAYLPPGVNFVFISQVWAEHPSVAASLLERCIGWADACARTQLRMESESDHDNYSGAWGFKTITETRAADLRELYGSSQYEDRAVGEAPAEPPTSGDASSTPILTGSVLSGDQNAEGDIRDRTPAQDQAPEHHPAGEGKGDDKREVAGTGSSANV